MTFQFSLVLVSAYNVIYGDAFCHRKNEEILNIPDGRFCLNGNRSSIANIINHVLECLPRFRRNNGIEFWSSNDRLDFFQ